MGPNEFTQGHLMKIEWLVTDVTSVDSPDRAERTIFRVILRVFFWLIHATFVVGKPFYYVGTPS